MKRLKALARSALIGLGVFVVVGSAGAAWLMRDPLPHFTERRSSLQSITPGMPELHDGYVVQPFRLAARSGLAVDLVVSRAVADSNRRLPLAVILGGHHTGAKAARMLGDHPGVLVAAMSYPYGGSPRPDALTFLRDIPAIRGAFLDTPPALMLALDYLLTRDDVDPRRAEAVGVSLGAPFVTIAGALDERFSRVWAVHGSGGSYAPLDLSMKRVIPTPWLRVPATALASVIIAGPQLDPVRWAPQIADRPFVMVNAEDDERMPREAVDALYASAREPKEIIWMSGGHVHGDAPTIQKLVAIVLPRVRSGT